MIDALRKGLADKMTSAKLVLGSIPAGAYLWMGLPGRYDLRPNPERTRQRENGEIGLRGPIVPIAGTDPRPRKNLRILDFRYPYHDYGRTHWAECTIALDLDKRRIDFGRSSSYLFDRQHKGSGLFGVAIFSLPFLLPVLPALLAVNGRWSAKERRAGMDRHCIAILKSLVGRIPSEDFTLLEECFRGTWTHERAMARKVSLLEAWHILSEAEQHEHRHEREPDEGLAEAGGTQYVWYDAQGEMIARADRLHRDPNPPVTTVLGSEFVGEDADSLVALGRRTKRFVNGKDAPLPA